MNRKALPGQSHLNRCTAGSAVGLLVVTLLAVPAQATERYRPATGGLLPLDPPGLKAGAGFGTSVALSGTVAVIGQPSRGGGSADVYSHGSSGWYQTAVLRGTDTRPGDFFGGAVAISGGTVVVGADNHDNGSGRAYVFTLERRGWHQTAELSSAGADPHSGFGFSVAVGVGTIVIGAQSGLGPGAAYVFIQGLHGWQQAASLGRRDVGAGALFGFSVATSGPAVVVGDPGYGAGVGRAYVFRAGGHGWRQTAELVGRDVGAGANFGYSVAVSEAQILVGAPSHGGGSAYIFGLATRSWPQSDEISSEGTQPGDSFGDSVALYEGLALIGAPAQKAGLAYLFVRTDEGWRQTAEMAGPAASGSLFGIAVAVSGAAAIIGADGYGKDAGGAWVATITRSVPANALKRAGTRAPGR